MSYRRNERCQRPKTWWFDFVFPFAFKNKHQFENFFSFIMEGIGTLWLFEFELSQNNRDVTAIISHSVSIFLLNASWVTEFVKFIFHIIKISNFRHKLAFIKWCVFKVLQYRWQNEIYNWHLKSFCRQKLKFPWHRQSCNRNINGDLVPWLIFS